MILSCTVSHFTRHMRVLRRSISFTLMVWTALFHLMYAQTQIRGDISAQTIWTRNNSPYILQKEVIVSENATLTIEPGVEIQLPTENSGLLIKGSLVAEGTATDTIRFRGTSINPSIYGGAISVDAAAKNVRLSYIAMTKMGEYHQASLVIYSSNATIKNSRIANGKGDGIRLFENAGVESCIIENHQASGIRMINQAYETQNNYGKILSPVISDCIVRRNKDFGIYIMSGGMKPKITNCTYAQNPIHIYSHPEGLDNLADINSSPVLFSREIRTNSVWPKLGSGQQITLEGGADLVVGENTQLTLQAGSVVNILSENCSFLIHGTLFAQGTETDSIRIQGPLKEKNNYGGSLFFSDKGKNSALSYVRLAKLGAKYQAALRISAQGVKINNSLIVNTMGSAISLEKYATIENCTIKASSKNGILITKSGQSLTGTELIKPEIKNCSILGSGNYGIYIETGACKPIVSACFLKANPVDICSHPEGLDNFENLPANVHILNEAIKNNSVWPRFTDKPEIVLANGAIRIEEGATLSIKPGVSVVFTGQSKSMYVAGTLLAEGTESDSIRFFSRSKDPKMGGDVYFDAKSKNSHLSYISMNKLSGTRASIESASASLIVDNCAIRNSTQSGIYIWEGNPMISNVLIEHCLGAGINLRYSGASITMGTIRKNGMGIVIESGKPKIERCVIFDNKEYGIVNLGLETIDARNCWWGNAKGPYHLVLNPSGVGNKISDNVLFN